MLLVHLEYLFPWDLQSVVQHAMLEFCSNQSRTEVLSLSQDFARIAQCFFRDNEPRTQSEERRISPDGFQLESTLEALAAECRRIPWFDVIFVCGLTDSKSTWKHWLEEPGSFERSVAELSSQLQSKASNQWLIVVSRDFEALILVQTLRRTFDVKKCRPLDSRIVAMIFLNSCEFGFPTLSKSSPGHYKPTFDSGGDNVLSSQLARSIWTFQRQKRPFRRIRILDEAERGLSQIYKGFDPDVWHEEATTRLTHFAYLLCGHREMNDCLFWAIWQSTRGHRKLQLAGSSVRPICSPTASSACGFCNHPKIYLEHLLWTRTPGARRTLLAVLRWVAYSLRPLEFEELFVAVSTPTNLNRGTETINTEPWLGNPDDLLTLCEGLLGRCGDGTIQFTHESVKDFFRSPAMRAVDGWKVNQVHEMMAVVCLHHAVCGDETALLRPWTQAGKQLREPGSRCCFRDYSTLYWHQHFRLAESSSMYLPSLLYQALQAALRKLDFESNVSEGILAVERRINQALQFCCCHDFLKVGNMFLEMGAKESTESWSAVHIAAAFGSTSLLELLIRNHVKYDENERLFEARWSQSAYSPLELAALHGRTTVVELLLHSKAGIAPLSESHWASAFVLAVEYCHQDVVESLLKYGCHQGHVKKVTWKALLYRALRWAKELEHDGIVGVITAYESNTQSDDACSQAIVAPYDSPQDAVVHVLESKLRKLDLSGLTDTDVVVRESSALGELGDWSLVGYTEVEITNRAHLDLDHC